MVPVKSPRRPVMAKNAQPALVKGESASGGKKGPVTGKKPAKNNSAAKATKAKSVAMVSAVGPQPKRPAAKAKAVVKVAKPKAASFGLESVLPPSLVRAERPRAVVPPPPPPAQVPVPPSSPLRHGLLFLVALIVGLSLTVAGLVILTNPRPTSDEVAPAPAGQMAAVAERAPFVSWLNRWRLEDEYLRIGEFRLAASWPIDPTDVVRPEVPADREMPRRSRLSFTVDGERFADWLGVPSLPVSRLLLSDGGEVFVAGEKTSPGYFQEGFWLDSVIFVALGTEAVRQPDGRPLCLGEAEARTCYHRLTADFVDMAARRRDTYVSEKHPYRADPFADELSRRALASMSTLEKVSVGVVAPELPRERAEGEVISRDDNGRMSVETEDGPLAAQVLVTTSVIDERGASVPTSFVRRGVSFLMEGVRDDVGRLTVISMEATDVPPVIVYAPEDTVLPGVPLQVRAIARAGIATVRVQLKSGSTLLAEETVELPQDDNPWQAVAVGLQPSRPLRVGESLRLYVFDAAYPEEGETVNLDVSQ